MPRLSASAPHMLLLLAALASARAAPAQEIAAVLTSKAGPYQAAYEGFAGAIGREVSVIDLYGRRLPGSGARVIVTFGGEAALQSYPKSSTLIVCLAPGLGDRLPHSGEYAIVAMTPAPERLLSELRRLQPGLAKLGILKKSPAAKPYIEGLERAGAAAGVRILSPSTSGKDGVPGALRELVAAGADAVWLSPDPALVTPENFQMILQFSRDRRVPFYVPTRGLAAAGAAASVHVDDLAGGRAAADLARRALANESLPRLVHPSETRITVNLRAAEKAGLKIDAKTLGSGVEVLP